MKRMIVALDQNRAIGKENSMMWMNDMPADLRRFRDVTTGHSVIMGRKTYESIGKPLKDRQNIVVSRSKLDLPDGAVWAASPEEAFSLARDEEVYVIGGAQLYEACLDIVDEIYVTEIHDEFEADTFFPELDKNKWREVERQDFKADTENKYAYSYVVYGRT